jgi:hypothetical protein
MDLSIFKPNCEKPHIRGGAHAERVAKVEEAGRVRGNALKLFAKRKKKMKSTS